MKRKKDKKMDTELKRVSEDPLDVGPGQVPTQSIDPNTFKRKLVGFLYSIPTPIGSAQKTPIITMIPFAR